MLGYMFVFVAGIVIGVIFLSLIRNILLSDGRMMIDQTDPDKDMYRLEIKDLDVLPKKKRILLKIVAKTEDTLKWHGLL